MWDQVGLQKTGNNIGVTKWNLLMRENVYGVMQKWPALCRADHSACQSDCNLIFNF